MSDSDSSESNEDCMSDGIDWDAYDVVVDVEPINSGYHYRLMRVSGSSELVFARRWEVYNHDDSEHQPRDGDEWEIVRGDEEISVEGVVGFSSK